MNPIERLLAALTLIVLGPLALTTGCTWTAEPEPSGRSLVVPTQESPWSFGDMPGQRIQTRHYAIFTTTDNRVLTDPLPGFMESAYEQYLLLTGLADLPEQPKSKPWLIYMLADRGQWVVMTEKVVGPQLAPLYLQIENGGYCFQTTCVFWDLRHFATFSTAAHEAFHQFFGHRMKDGLPSWIEEGMCVQVEGFTMGSNLVRFTPNVNPMRVVDLRQAMIDGRTLPLRKLLATNPDQEIVREGAHTAEYYGQLYALVAYIRSVPAYRAGLQRMLRDAADGKMYAAISAPASQPADALREAISVPVFRHYITTDLDKFEQEYKAFAHHLAGLDDAPILKGNKAYWGVKE